MTDPVQRLGPAILLQGAAVLDANYLITLGVREARRNGIPAPARILALLDALAKTAAATRRASADGHADVPDHPLPGQSVLTALTTKEAADMLDLSERQIRRLAPDLGGRLRHRTWTFDRGAVAAYAEHRKAAS